MALAVPSGKPTSTPSSPSKFVAGKMVNGKRVAKVMKDGTILCQNYQRGECKQKGKCANGAHRCGVIIRGERVCGAPGHTAATCRSAVKE